MAEEVRAGRKRKAAGVYVLGFNNLQVPSKPFLCPFCGRWDLWGEQHAHLSLVSVKLLDA